MRAAVGYPSGARHEAGSVKVAESKNLSPLTLHLIAAHHGYARPAMSWWSEDPEFRCRVQIDGAEVEFDPGSTLGSIDSPVIERFWSLCRSLGFWRLALLEGILRLADHRQSKEEMNA
jgi:CRISPR-associated endonuclease/helicase Cas3